MSFEKVKSPGMLLEFERSLDLSERDTPSPSFQSDAPETNIDITGANLHQAVRNTLLSSTFITAHLLN